MLRIFQAKENKVVRSSRESLRNSIPVLKGLLMHDIESLERLCSDDENAGVGGSAQYTKSELARVLKAAVNVHLKLKLSKLKPAKLPVLKYLSPIGGAGFSASCFEVMSHIEDAGPELKSLYYTQLRNLYIYLLCRLEEL